MAGVVPVGVKAFVPFAHDCSSGPAGPLCRVRASTPGTGNTSTPQHGQTEHKGDPGGASDRSIDEPDEPERAQEADDEQRDRRGGLRPIVSRDSECRTKR